MTTEAIAVSRHGLAAFLLLFVATHGTGCMSWSVGEPRPAIVAARPGPVADRAILEVDDSRVSWSRGRMGALTRQTLIELGSFREVYYPVEPRNAPPLRIAIEAVGRESEKPGIRTLKVIFIVALGFLPVGVVTFDKEFTLEAKATLWLNGTVLQQLDLATSARMSSTLFYDRATAEETLGGAMFLHLAAQLAVGLTPVSASFQPPLAARNQVDLISASTASYLVEGGPALPPPP